MTSIYRFSPAKRTKAVAGSPGSGGGGSGSGAWSHVGPEHAPGNSEWRCPRKTCLSLIAARQRKNSSSFYAVCETRKQDDPTTCQTFFNLNKKQWGNNADHQRLCEWCETDTAESPSIGVPNEAADSSTKRESHFFFGNRICCLLYEKPPTLGDRVGHRSLVSWALRACVARSPTFRFLLWYWGSDSLWYYCVPVVEFGKW